MATHLSFDFTFQPPPQQPTLRANDTWIDVSDIAAGVGSTGPVQISSALEDGLKPRQDETESDHDQRLFDLLWLAHFRLALDHVSSIAFNFTFQRRTREKEKTFDAHLRIRVEVQAEVVRLGLVQDF